ncbi:hypothetical protein BD560DRAFT_399062 [Blakeslea trispora]|nr:hypothetical protein BD560DRAFT_399062 [Blakeslea trispora]
MARSTRTDSFYIFAQIQVFESKPCHNNIYFFWIISTLLENYLLSTLYNYLSFKYSSSDKASSAIAFSGCILFCSTELALENSVFLLMHPTYSSSLLL